ncbi:uncharacterized protein BO72DRAFT_500015 [Aspergillus fijiensis CBS 313.89]|uniref:Uncharacterized protein n=1 Tax=Aspergillus fijiensis CBS 313.89 TaxID=1448319 RepID=A0A8G1VY01_9EURO|nr:uncharacterized protein BO72DRAFT_500015 [Aspergillus fijiensis CBS 313.89]RAK73519.1 hypothetical protein BO72DRAFT_500015 [Aspergillus fijiensis CBS 313.89]
MPPASRVPTDDAHPFPGVPSPQKPKERIDADGFHRAVALLAHQGTKLLGTQEVEDNFWRQDTAFLRKGHIARVLRSIGRSDWNSFSADTAPAVLSDAVDVLATTQPSPAQLQAAAGRLLVESGSPVRYLVVWGELARLLGLVLRLRTIIADGELVSAEIVDMMMDAPPNLLSHFHQLWAAPFQPQLADDDTVFEQVDDMQSRLLAAASLFIPLPEASAHLPTTSSNPHLTLKRLETIQEPNVLTSHHLASCIPCTATCTSTSFERPIKTRLTMLQQLSGNFPPRAIMHESRQQRKAKPQDLRRSPALSAAAGVPNSPMGEVTHTAQDLKTHYELASLKSDGAEGAITESAMQAYIIDDPKKARMRINTATKTVSMHSSVALGTSDRKGHRDVTLCGSRIATEHGDWEVVVQPC